MTVRPNAAIRSRFVAHATAGAVLAGLTLVCSFAASAPTAHAATAYRYWAFYVASGSDWQYSQRGPAGEYPVDGQVQGWRFGIQPDAGANLAPRKTPSFDQLCASTAPKTGQLRVGVVLDFGIAADAPAGEHPPAGPVVGCVSVPDGANGITVLDAAVGSDGVRIGIGSDAGLVCGIAGYPKTECAVTVDTTTIHPSPTPSATHLAPRIVPPTVSPTQASSQATATSSGTATQPTTAPAGNSNPATAAASVPAATAPALASPSAAPAPAPASASGSPVSLRSLRASQRRSRLPASAIVGVLLVLALAIGTAIRIRRGRQPAS